EDVVRDARIAREGADVWHGVSAQSQYTFPKARDELFGVSSWVQRNPEHTGEECPRANPLTCHLHSYARRLEGADKVGHFLGCDTAPGPHCLGSLQSDRIQPGK